MSLGHQLESLGLFNRSGRRNSGRLHLGKTGEKTLIRGDRPFDAGEEFVTHRSGQATGVWSSIWERLPYRLQGMFLILMLLALGAWIRASFWIAAVRTDAFRPMPRNLKAWARRT